MADCLFVDSVLDFTCFDVVDSTSDIHGDGAGLGVRHQALRTEDFTETTDNTHHVGSCDDDVIIKPVFLLDLLNHLFAADEICACSLSFVRFCALADCKNTDGFTGTVGKNHNATDLLICVTGIDTEFDVQFYRFIEFGLCGLNGKSNSFSALVKFGAVDEFFRINIMFTAFHTNLLILPQERPCCVRYLRSYS